MINNVKKRSVRSESRLGLQKSAIAMTLALLGAGNAVGAEIKTNNSDLAISWDNNFRYNLGARVEQRDNRIGGNPNYDESDYKFDRGDIVTNRVDLLSEFNLSYKDDAGFRVSAAAWYDDAYRNSLVKTNPVLAAAGWQSSYVNDRYSKPTKRYSHGLSGELLDAFVFTKVNVAEVPVYLKLGRHTVYWGESLLSAAHGIAYSMQPVDFDKALNGPGSSTKELFRPLNQISGQAQLTDTLSVTANYYLEWEPFRLPEGGTYLGLFDGIVHGPNRLPLAPGFSIPRMADLEPEDRGNWGVGARWRPDWLDGTAGVYYRRFDEKLPWVLLTGDPANPATYGYRLGYARDVKLYGLSLAKEVAGLSIGVDLSYRENTAFNSAAGFATEGARGDSINGVVNALGLINKTPLFDTATYLVEMTYNRWVTVRSNPQLFNADGFAPCAGRDKYDGCITKNYYGVGATFTPTWFQPIPSVDISMPMSYSVGLKGNAAVRAGGYQGEGNYSIGIVADYQNKYNFSIKYNDYLIKIKDNLSVNGETPLRDRGWIVATFKTTF